MGKEANFFGSLVVLAILIVLGFIFAIKGSNELEQFLGIVVMTGAVMTGIPMQLSMDRE